jgi:DNA (cytosine-5)-methyltransferase 1
LFAGAGGFSVGFENAGFDIVAAVEYDKQIAETYSYNHFETKVFAEDIKQVVNKVDFSQYNCDVIIGGPPCQGFSMAGARIRKNNFIDDPRNYLFKYYFKIVQQVKPKIFILENVKGILTMEKGEIFKQIISLFSDEENFNGNKYYIEYRIVKALEYGIPQQRERVFIIGSLNKKLDIDKLILKTKKILIKKYPHFFDSVTVWDAISNLKNEDTEGNIQNLKPENQYQKFLANNSCITFNHIKPHHNKIALKRIKQIGNGENWTKLKDVIKSVHSGAYGRLVKNGVAPTITTRFDTPSGGRFIHPVEDRTLSPREGARIQSFPDNFKFLGTKTSIYKQIGNAVPPKLAYFWGTLIREAIDSD